MGFWISARALTSTFLSSSVFVASIITTVTIAVTTTTASAGGTMESPQFVDQRGTPLVGATVLIGFAPGQPFSGNVVVTDQNGKIPSVPSQWTSPLPVTIESADHIVRTTFYNVSADGGRLTAELADGTERIEIKGQTTDFGNLRRDGKVDFGLVLPAMNRRQMLHFDLGSVISPENDRISVGPVDFDLPSNLTLPEQRESYIIPILLNKPDYRVYVRRPGSYSLSATHGQFPLRKVVGDLREGKSVFEVINDFEFIGSGQLQVQADKSIAEQNISVNQAAFSEQTSVVGAKLPANRIMISMAMVEKAGQMYPTDLKRVEAGQTMPLKTVSGSDPRYVLSVQILNDSATIADIEVVPNILFDLQKLFMPPLPAQLQSQQLNNPAEPVKVATTSKTDHLSFVLQPAGQNEAPVFLDYVDKPVVADQTLTLKMPALPEGLQPLGTYAVLSEVTVLDGEHIKTEIRTRLWELYQSSWVDKMQLPALEWTRKPDKKYRWEVLYMARKPGVGSEEPNGAYDLNGVTHITRSSLDF